MTDILKIAIPAVIALIGTILTIFFAYRQWKRQHTASRYESYFPEKHSAYKELWMRLEDVHLKLRTDDVSEEGFRKLVLEVNSYILKHALYLDERDRELANEYLKAVRRMKTLVLESNNRDAIWAMQSSMPIPSEVTLSAKELRQTVLEVDQIRGTLIERFRQIVGGN